MLTIKHKVYSNALGYDISKLMGDKKPIEIAYLLGLNQPSGVKNRMMDKVKTSYAEAFVLAAHTVLSEDDLTNIFDRMLECKKDE